MRQPHQTSDMLPNFIFFAYLKTLMTYLQSTKKYGAAAKIGKVMKDYVQKG